MVHKVSRNISYEITFSCDLIGSHKTCEWEQGLVSVLKFASAKTQVLMTGALENNFYEIFGKSPSQNLCFLPPTWLEIDSATDNILAILCFPI